MKYAKAKHVVMGGGKFFFLVFSVDDRKNTKTKLKGSVNLTVHLKL